MKLSCEGINGSAYARAELDEEKLLDYLTELFEKEQRGAYGAAGENFDAATEAESAVNSIKNTWREQFVTMADPSENLSNGDEVTVTLTPSYTDNNEVNMVGAGFTLIGGSGTFTVDSLGDYHLGITSTEDEELKAFLAPMRQVSRRPSMRRKTGLIRMLPSMAGLPGIRYRMAK
ncbi:MAG: hypothetical protein ACLR2E_14290 [Lachnospiraceae bacterium]